MEQLTGSKLGKEYDKAVYFHTVYLTNMQSPSYEILGWVNHKLESRFPGEISTTLDMQMIHSRAPPGAQLVENPPAMQETPVRFLDQENPLENR